jgi:hypothetical protein
MARLYGSLAMGLAGPSAILLHRPDARAVLPSDPPLPAAVPAHVNGTRVAIALACWLPASVGVLSSLMFTGASLFSLITGPGQAGLGQAASYVGLCVPGAWVALAVMTVAWVKNRKAHWAWPAFGSLNGVAAALLFHPFWFLYFSAAGLAVYLAWFHLRTTPAKAC